ncbi:hypothetical protein G7054_g12670 [Neopestalotiopsis clavispora]|nr:hypothetical protein G7054_g12670 [Neopestalotiopsis clavispora]
MPSVIASSRQALVVARFVSGISCGRRQLQFFHPLERQTPPVLNACISARHIGSSSIKQQTPLPKGDEEGGRTKINIMNPQDFYGGHANHAPPPSFNPFAGVFAPGMMMMPPMQTPSPSSWSSQPQYHGQHQQRHFQQQQQHQQPHHHPQQRHGHQGRGQSHQAQAQANNAVTSEAAEDSDSSPSVGGEPMPQLTPHQMQNTTIPILDGAASSGKKPHKKKARKLLMQQQQQQQQAIASLPAGTSATNTSAKSSTKKRPYAKPGAASGGVPNPSKAYIAQSARPPSILAEPRRILVIIDLNGTLLHRPNAKKSSTFVERPFTRTFLQYCLQTFVVAIWSSAKPENVGRMVPQILSREDQARLVAVWGRDTLGLSEADYHQRVQCYKRLERFWGDEGVAASHPEFHATRGGGGARWDQTNTVLIDDSKEKARSQPYNIIQLPEFEGDVEEGGYVLPQVHNYLNELAFQSDISSFIRERPFKFDPSFTLASAA